MNLSFRRNLTHAIGVEYPTNVIILIGSTFTSLGTVLGNGLIITAFIMEKKIRIPSNYFIASLAVTDILIGIFSMNLFAVYVVLGYWPLGSLLCNIWLSFDYTVCLTSQYTVLLITVDRYCSVKIPAKYRVWRTDRKVYILIVLAWIIPAGLFFTIIITWNENLNSLFIGERQCFAEFTLNSIFNTILTIIYFWITLVIMCVLYIGIYRVARRLHKNSDTKRKRLTSLMATAGQTMSKIGVGLSLANLEANGPFKKFMNDDPYDQTELDKNYFNDKGLYPGASRNTFSISSKISRSDEMNNLTVNKNFPKSQSETIFTDCQRSSTTFLNGNQFAAFDDIRFIDDESSNGSRYYCGNNVSSRFRNRYNLPIINLPHSTLHTRYHMDKDVKYKSWDNSLSKSALKALRFLRNVHNISKKIDIHNRTKAKKSFKTISFILGAFIFCWTPYHILILVKGFCDNQATSCVNSVLYHASYWLCYINSPINPFCYALSNSQFKTTLIKLIKGDFSRS